MSAGGDADCGSFHTPGDSGCLIVQMFVDIRSLFPPKIALEGWKDLGSGDIEDLDPGWWDCRRAGGLRCGNTGC